MRLASRLFYNIALVIAYLLLCALGQLFPPGDTGIPPIAFGAGLGIVAVLIGGSSLLPGVAIGAAIATLPVFTFHVGIHPFYLPMALADAAGVSLQAALGAALVRQHAEEKWQDLLHDRDTLVFFGLAAIVASVVAPTTHAASAMAFGLLDTNLAGGVWTHFYISNVLGVFIVAPIVISLLRSRTIAWQDRVLVQIPVMVVCIILILLAAQAINRWDEERQTRELETTADIIAQQLARRAVAHHEILGSLARMYEISPDFNYADFEHLTRVTLLKNPDVFALSLNPLVTATERAAFETKMRVITGRPQYRIVERASSGKLVAAGDRPYYVPVGFIGPLQGNERALGFDTNSNPLRSHAIERALATGDMALTAPIRLIQESSSRPGVLALSPAYSFARTGADGKRAPIGFAVAVLKADLLINIATTGLKHEGIDYTITDENAPEGQRMLYFSGQEPSATVPESAWRRKVQMGDRSWQIATYHTSTRSLLTDWAWIASVIGGLLAAALQFVLMSMTGRTALVRQLVAEQTAEIESQRDALAGSEQRYRQLFAHSHAPQLLIDPFNGRIVAANLAAEHFYGYREHELLAMDLTDLVDESKRGDQPQALPGYDTRPQRTEHRLKSGEVRTVDCRVASLQFGERHLRLLEVQDTTEQNALEESRNRQLAYLRAMNDLGNRSAGLDITARLTEALRLGTSLLGLEVGIIGQTRQGSHRIVAAVAEDSAIRAGLEFDLQDTLCSITLAENDIVAVEHMGRSRYQHMPCYLKCNQEAFLGAPIRVDGQIYGTVHFSSRAPYYRLWDDNDREFVSLIARWIGARLERDFTQQQLAESDELLRNAIEAIGEAFVIYDPEDRLIFCNDRYKDLYKTSAPAIVPGATFESILRYGAERGQYQEANGRIDEWLAERLEAHLSGNTDLEQPLDDGRWLRIRERKTTSGHIVGFRVDVTELFEAKEAAERANVAKSQFLATMSHELRTPMNGVLGMAQLLKMPDLSEDERLEYAEAILESGNTLLSLLNDILDLSKIEANALELRPTSFDPAIMLNHVAGLFRPNAQGKGLELRAEWRGTPGRQYLGDETRLRQMIANLVSNAIKFTDAGQITISGETSPSDDGGAQIRFEVTDTGCGIAPEQQSLLFKPFSQVDGSSTRRFGGTGLGLSIVRRLANMMQGDAGVTSAAGKGSTFWFTAHLEPIHHETPRVASPPVQSTSQPDQSCGTVLVVEDNAINRKVVKSMLVRQGYACFLADDGQQAVDMVTQGAVTPDLILMDCQMPVMDGLEATRHIRRWETGESRTRVPIIALTASAFAEDKARCDEAGMDDFLSKPVDFNALETLLKQWIDSSAPPRPASPRPDASVVQARATLDESSLFDRFDQDSDLIMTALENYRSEWQDLIRPMRAALQADDLDSLTRHAHSIRGVAATISGVAVTDLALAIETRARHGERDGLEAQIDLIEQQARQLSDAAARLLERLPHPGV